jgi:cytochrome c biogenesis protein CcmG/thiol:disulfide interchange protein DsbE
MAEESRMKLVGIIAAMALSSIVAFADAVPRDQRKAAPAFRLETINGNQISLSAYRGRVVLLDFWATWCTGCKVEIPWFIEFDKKYRHQGLTTIGIAMDEQGKRVIAPYVNEHRIPYSIASGFPALVKPYAITALPVTLLIDKEGRIADVHAGVVDKTAWEQQIQALLRESNGRARR